MTTSTLLLRPCCIENTAADLRLAEAAIGFEKPQQVFTKLLRLFQTRSEFPYVARIDRY